jgi:hypothetical protein
MSVEENRIALSKEIPFRSTSTPFQLILKDKISKEITFIKDYISYFPFLFSVVQKGVL